MSPVAEVGPSLTRALDSAKVGPVGTRRRQGLLISALCLFLVALMLAPLVMRNYASVDFAEVSITGAFWAERLDTVLTRTTSSECEKLGRSGILESVLFLIPPPPLRMPRGPTRHTHQLFWDPDLGKWIEAASYALRHRRDPGIESKINDIVDKLAAAQVPDGYPSPRY